MICIAISSDAKGHGNSSTLLASIVRRTKQPVHVRCWCRGYLPPSFESGRLKVEFLPAEEEVTGRYPGHVNQAVFDRLRIIRDGSDWERCLIMDHDMIALCDLAPYFAEDFEGNLLMGRLFGTGNTLGLQMRQRGGLPEEWRHAENHPYFFMGPMMNLAAMRKEGTWDKLLDAHRAIGQDEQLSLTAACDGRTKGVGKKWNLVPQWDKLGEQKIPVRGTFEKDGIPWQQGVPEGIIHWTGPSKPWHRSSVVWRPDLWEGERTTWEHLREGMWEKPLAIEIEPQDGIRVRALARRGWRVEVFAERFSGPANEELLDSKDEPNPEVILNGIPSQDPGQALRRIQGLDGVEIVRFGRNSSPSRWLEGSSALPEHVAVRGPAERAEVRWLKEKGYLHEARIDSPKWATGGPSPKVLEYQRSLADLAVSDREELYLKLGPPPAEGELSSWLENNGEPAPVEAGDEDTWPWRLSEGAEELLKSWSAGLSASEEISVLELGSGHGTTVLAELFPNARIVSLEHHASWYNHCARKLAGRENVTLRHAPIDGTLPWFDCREIDFDAVDLLVVPPALGEAAKAIRAGASCLVHHLKPGARVLLDGVPSAERQEILFRWMLTRRVAVESDEGDRVVLIARGAIDALQAFPAGEGTLRNMAERFYVISLPEREDRRLQLRKNWETAGLDFEVIDGVRLEPSEIRWEEMKGMEAYGKAENLRGNYIPGAVGCKRAGIKALRAFLESGAKTALICQDDCLWKPDAGRTVERALRELPAHWDLLYFSASSREKNTPYSPHLVKLGGARFCNAILWNRFAAARLLPELEACDCEWDLFMQRSHARMNAFCVTPMPAYQAKSRSDIVLGVVQPPNR